MEEEVWGRGTLSCELGQSSSPVAPLSSPLSLFSPESLALRLVCSGRSKGPFRTSVVGETVGKGREDERGAGKKRSANERGAASVMESRETGGGKSLSKRAKVGSAAVSDAERGGE